ncbi:hypothetical protein ACWGIB_23895 [Streptomyces xiamenensis]
MDLFFVSRARVQQRPALFDGLGTQAVGLLDYRVLPDGLPVMVDAGLRPAAADDLDSIALLPGEGAPLKPWPRTGPTATRRPPRPSSPEASPGSYRP